MNIDKKIKKLIKEKYQKTAKTVDMRSAKMQLIFTIA